MIPFSVNAEGGVFLGTRDVHTRKIWPQTYRTDGEVADLQDVTHETHMCG